MSATMKTSVKAMAFMIMLLLWLAGATCPQSAYAAQLEAGDAAAGALDVSAQSENSKDYVFDKYTKYENGYSYEQYRIHVLGVTSGTVSYDAKSKTLTLQNVWMSGIRLYNNAVITIKLIGNNVASGDYFIRGESSSKCSVTVIGSGTASGGTCGAIDVGGNVTLSGGSISSNNCNDTSIDCDGLVVNGGSILLSYCLGESGINCNSFKLAQGSVSIDNQGGIGLQVRDLLTITGGDLSVTRCYRIAIDVSGYTEGGKTYRGKTTPSVHHDGVIKITGGKVTATTREHEGHRPCAIQADKMSNKPSHLKKIGGLIWAQGATFEVGGNVYASGVIRYSQTSSLFYGAKLVKYNGKSKTPDIVKVKYGGCTYAIGGIGSDAFNTKQGRKVKRVTLGWCDEANAYAFRGAKALSEIRFIELSVEAKYSGNDNLKWVKWPKDSRINKKAFAKCGKNGKVKVSIFAYTKTKRGQYGGSFGYFKKGKKIFGVYEKYASKYKRLFTSKGMSKSFKLKTYK